MSGYHCLKCGKPVNEHRSQKCVDYFFNLAQIIRKERDEAQARIKALEGAIDNAEEHMPWPESVWIMTEKDYIDATPDTRLRTAISGYLMRRGWNLALKYIHDQLEAV